MQTKQAKGWLNYLFAVIIAIFLFNYFTGIVVQKPFSDDWMILEIGRELHGKPLIEWLTVKDNFNVWRPLPFILKGLYLKGSSRDLVIYNSFKLLLFLLAVAGTYVTANFLTKDKKTAFFSALLFFLNPTTIGAVQNVDHIYKITGTLFFALSVFFLLKYVERNKGILFALFLLSYVCAFFSDADALGIFPAIFFILAMNYNKVGFKKMAGILFVSAAVIIVYLYLRSVVCGGMLAGGVSDRQEIVLNQNIVYNAVKLFLSSFIFTMSPYVYLKKPLYIFMALFFIVVNFYLIFTAFRKSSSEHRKQLFLLSVLSFAAMVPFILIRHVSEIYSIRAAYLLMIILAYSFLSVYRESEGMYRKLLSVYICVMLISGAYSILTKQKMMIERGIMAEHMANSMKQILPHPPKFSAINITVDDCGVKETYSDFINNDVQLAKIGFNYDYFIRYNYNDSTLNSSDENKEVFNLVWDCNKKEFFLQQ